LIAKSFVPPVAIGELRDPTRYRRKLSQAGASERNRLLKLLEMANLKLSGVVSDVFAVSGRHMPRALIAGEASHKILIAYIACSPAEPITKTSAPLISSSDTTTARLSVSCAGGARSAMRSPFKQRLPENRAKASSTTTPTARSRGTVPLWRPPCGVVSSQEAQRAPR
jgi:hypothetical protein